MLFAFGDNFRIGGVNAVGGVVMRRILELVGEVLDTMRLLSDAATTMLVVTHEIGFARDVSDRVTYVH